VSPRLAAVAALVCAACGSHAGLEEAPLPDAPVGDGPGLGELCGAVPTTPDAWEDCYLRRWCAWYVGCVPLNPYRDAAECVARADEVEGGRLTAERRARELAVAAGRAHLEPAAFARCLDDLSESRCNTARFSPACAARYRGEIADGGACSSSAECASPGATCASGCTDACCGGTCEPKAALGEVCSDFDGCQPGLRCHGTCRAGDIGTACGAHLDCDPEAWCDAGTCAADLPVGAACTNPLQCGGNADCIGLSIAHATPGTCQPISSPGDRCDGLCYGNLYCAGDGRCRALPGEGESCGAVPCRGVELYCRGGVCAPRSSAGESCTDSLACAPGLFCTSELGAPAPACAVRQGAGEPCTSSNQCGSRCCDAGLCSCNMQLRDSH
jgi:hypothetical protein